MELVSAVAMLRKRWEERAVDIKSLLPWLVLLTFNVPIMAALVCVTFSARLSDVLKEKSPLGDCTGITSYSRVIGAVGGVIVTAFFWAGGNILIASALALEDFTQLTKLIDALSRFLLFGSALFLPYAFNQLKSLFPRASNAAANVALLQKVPPTQTLVLGAPTRLKVVNLSDSVSDAELKRVLAAIDVQVSQHFGPEWRCSVVLSQARMDLAGKMPAVDTNSDAIIYLGDTTNSTVTGLLYAKGFHDKNLQGVPYGFVFLDVCKLYGEHWSVTLSHEVLELLADPTAALSVADPRPGAEPGWQYALEVCDPTQGDHYLIGDVLVCNFVNRSFYGLQGGAAAMNYRKFPQAPFSPRENGYVQYQDSTGASQQIWGTSITDGQKAARERMGDARRNARRKLRGLRADPSTV
jgi:hypothetical protein